ESVLVRQTPAFTSRPRTPWGQKVSPSVIGKNLTRIVGEQIYPDGVEMPDRGMAPVLQIGRMSVPAEVDAEWNAWYSGEYVPGYRKVPGVIYARRYRVLEGTSGYSTVYEFASTAVPLAGGQDAQHIFLDRRMAGLAPQSHRHRHVAGTCPDGADAPHLTQDVAYVLHPFCFFDDAYQQDIAVWVQRPQVGCVVVFL